jgi:Helix-turn-helix domain
VANNVLNWVWQHSRSRHAARLVLLAIADRAHEDGVAWPSNAELKRMTGLGERAVQTAVIELARSKELQVQYQQGPGGVNRYRVSMQVKARTPAKSAPPPQTLRPAESAPPQDVRDESSQVDPQDPANFAPPQDLRPPAESAPGTLTNTFTNSPTESSRGGVGGQALFGNGQPTPPKRPARRRKQPAPSANFERWYAAYPVHKARGDAEKAWQSEVADPGVDVETVVAAALRYREDSQVRRGFGKYPAGWLRAKCWLDEPGPGPQADAARNGHRPGHQPWQNPDEAEYDKPMFPEETR